MDDGKPIASLSPRLLARKGAARPAMRQQFQVFGWNAVDSESETDSPSGLSHADPGHVDLAHDDLGWNDMGEDRPSEADATAVPVAGARGAKARVLHLPMVVRQREGLAAALSGPAMVPDAVARRSALADGRRAAFTLRVDAERHLRLRMACAVRNRSAQQLVTEALDRVLAEVDGLEGLARGAKRSRQH